MKRRQRRPVLDINNEQSESTRGRWQNKYQQIAVDHPEQNGSNATQNNPLASLLGQYNSDSENEDGKQESNSHKLNDKVNDFLKEIQLIAPDTKKSNDTGITETQRNSSQQNENSNCSWQECFDETTGYPYYWHIETNEVTWEMPTEMKILRDNSSQKNQNHSQQHQQISHSQLQQQWANFLPNTYPELQTNIPEGMIPKEIVARNRNRQVGFAKGRQDAEIRAQILKKSRPRDVDSDDEKIEMITSFGNDESESETSETDSPVKKDTPGVVRADKSSANLPSEKNPGLDKTEETVSIGPLLPPGIIPMVHGPENASLEMRSELESDKTQNVREDFCTESKEAVIKTEDINELDILKRLKNQAKLLQSLGGEVPKSVETLIKSDPKSVEEEEEDIISQIEREMPVDYAVDKIGDLNEGGGGIEFTEKNKAGINIVEEIDTKKKTRSKDFKISLVAGYSDDSDMEEESSPKKVNPQPLFPISEFIVKENSNLLKVSGNSNLQKERKELSAIDPVSGKLDIKQIDPGYEDTESAKNILLEDSLIGNENHSEFSINESDSVDTEENKLNKPENETARQQTFFENLEIPNKAFQRKKRIAFDVVPNKIIRSQSDSTGINPPKSETIDFEFTGLTSHDDVERLGFGFHKEKQPDIEGTDCFSSEIVEKPKGGDRDSTQFKKPINFVKGETSEPRKSDDEKSKKPHVEKPDPQAECTKKLKELTEVVMEKIKFLSEGSQSLSAIQIMVIQLQTLIVAWEAGDLRESYLYEWLKGTELELGRLEEAAAPPGWDCHWDRSHKRYYYRNSVTGDAQWTYPEADVVGGTEEMDLCTTPPPPEDEELLIIEEEARNGSTDKPKDPKSLLPITCDNKIVQITKDEYKSLEAPPPPQISSPSPPPPPRIFAEDIKKGKKRRGSINDRSCLDPKKEKKTESITADSSEEKNCIDPPLPPLPTKNTSQPPLPPNPPIIPNPPSSEPLPPGVDPKDMPYPLPTVTNIEPGNIVYAGTTQQTNPIYAATIGDGTAITLPIIDHRSAIIQGQLMHYPTYQHLHNQAMIAAAGTLGSQEAVQFMITDYTQVYANTQVIAKPPVKKSQNDQSLGSALDSFYNDIASIEKTNAEQESVPQEYDATNNITEANTPPPAIATLPPPPPTIAVPINATTDIEDKTNSSIPESATGKEKKKKKAKIGIGKKQKEMSSMVAKWQKAQQDFDDSE